MALPKHQVEDRTRDLVTVSDVSTSKAHAEAVNDAWGANASAKQGDAKSSNPTGDTGLPTLQLVSQDSVEKGISEKCNPVTGAVYKGIWHAYKGVQNMEDSANHAADNVKNKVDQVTRVVTDPWNRLMSGLTPPGER